jgi:hypothetical protein
VRYNDKLINQPIKMTVEENLEMRLTEIRQRLTREREKLEEQTSNSSVRGVKYGIHKGRIQMLEDEASYIESLIN